jgi:hypothetical protein
MIKYYLLVIISYSLLFNNVRYIQSKICVFGDSHARYCFTNDGSFIPLEKSTYLYKSGTTEQKVVFHINYLGPITMHRIGRDGLKFLNLKKFTVSDHDRVVFVFGEIDIRCHIGKIRDKNLLNLDTIINQLVINYLLTIEKNIALFKNIQAIVMAPIPPIPNQENALWPMYGTIEDRINITHKMHKILKHECDKRKILFLSMHDELSVNNILNFAISDRSVHVHPKYNYIIKNKLIDLVIANSGEFNVKILTN